MSQSKTTDALEILRRRYVGDDPGRIASFRQEKLNTEIARLIAQLRAEEGLTQSELAKKIGTTQSVVSRLEDADYEGHSLSMLNRVAQALNQKIKLSLEPNNPDIDTVRLAFREVLRRLRLLQGYSVENLANRLDIAPAEVLALEQNDSYRPSPLLLHKISKLYDIPQRRLAVLAGAVRDVPSDLRDHASKFAAMSESFSKLAPEERKELDKFVKFLRSES